MTTQQIIDSAKKQIEALGGKLSISGSNEARHIILSNGKGTSVPVWMPESGRHLNLDVQDLRDVFLNLTKTELKF